MLKFYVPHKSHDHSDFFMTMLGSWGITVVKQRIQQLVTYNFNVDIMDVLDFIIKYSPKNVH